MKKIIWSLLIIALVNVASGQDSKFKIGFKFTPNISWMRPDAKEMTSEGNVFRIGFGMNVDKMFSQTYAIGTGLNIAQSGGELTFLQKSKEADVTSILERRRTYKLQYVEVPLTLKLRTNEVGYITYWGQFGIGLGMNLRAKGDDEVNYLLYKGPDGVDPDGLPDWIESPTATYLEEDLDIKDDIRIFRASLIVGLGMEYNLSGNTSLIAGFTFNNGFTNVMQGLGVKTDTADNPVFENVNENNPVEYKLRAFNNYVELNIGILF